MNLPKINEYDYIDFLIGTQQMYSYTEVERVQSGPENGPAHNAVTRMLHQLISGQ